MGSGGQSGAGGDASSAGKGGGVAGSAGTAGSAGGGGGGGYPLKNPPVPSAGCGKAATITMPSRDAIVAAALDLLGRADG